VVGTLDAHDGATQKVLVCESHHITWEDDTQKAQPSPSNRHWEKPSSFMVMNSLPSLYFIKDLKDSKG